MDHIKLLSITRTPEGWSKLVTLESTCPRCGKVQIIEVSIDEMVAWEDGAMAQDAFPELSASQREALITGICDECWNKMALEEQMEEQA